MGATYQMLEKYDLARKLHNEALELNEITFGPKSI